MESFVAIDVETANSFLGSICQIGAVRFRDGVEVGTLSTLIDPRDAFDPFNIAIHGITEDMVEGMPAFAEVWPELTAFVGNDLVASHTLFDRSSIAQACASAQAVVPTWPWLNTVRVARRVWSLESHSLKVLTAHLGIAHKHHDALEDARAAGLILTRAVAESGIPLTDWPRRVERPVDGIDRSRIKLTGSTEGPLSGECVVFTGAAEIPKAELGTRANALGAAIDPRVTMRTTILVVGDQDLRKLNGHAISSNQRKAEELIAKGAPIRRMSASDFMKLY